MILETWYLLTSTFNKLSKLIHNYPYNFNVRWLAPLLARIQLQVPVLIIYRSSSCLASKNTSLIFICLTTSSASLRPLHSPNRRELFVPRARTGMTKSRVFCLFDRPLWNQLLPMIRSLLQAGGLPASSRCLRGRQPYCIRVSRTDSSFNRRGSALYKSADTIPI